MSDGRPPKGETEKRNRPDGDTRSLLIFVGVELGIVIALFATLYAGSSLAHALGRDDALPAGPILAYIAGPAVVVLLLIALARHFRRRDARRVPPVDENPRFD
jgi:hypothetical protein